MVEVRPRVATGVLLHAYTSKEEYLTVYVHNNQVRCECPPVMDSKGSSDSVHLIDMYFF